MPTIVRTPRKDKVWSVSNISEDGGWNLNGGPNIYGLTVDFLTDLGLSKSVKLTVMRVVGKLWLGPLGAASTAAYDSYDFGFSWVPEDVKALAGGSAAIQSPLEDGIRRSRWYHQFTLGGKERTATTEVGMPLEPVEDSIYHFDVSNMQKQSNPGDTFCLTAADGNLGTHEAATVGLFGSLSIMFAIP